MDSRSLDRPSPLPEDGSVMQYILKRTITEEYEYDRDKVLVFVNDNPDVIDIKEWMDLDDIIIELFEATEGSIFADRELFGQIDQDSSTTLLLRRDDE
jgi:hypothetical protein